MSAAPKKYHLMQKFVIRSADGDEMMSAGHRGSVRCWFENNEGYGELLRFEECDLVVIVVGDIRDERAA